MNKYLSAALAASLLAMPSLTRADDTLTTDKDKVSYSMGVDMGRNLQKQGIDVNPDVLIAGLKDGIAGGALKMTDEQMQATMTDLHPGHAEKMQAKEKGAGRGQQDQGGGLPGGEQKEGWLEDHRERAAIQGVTTGTGEKPKATDTVVTQYRGTTIDGTEFDSSYKRNEPAEFPVNAVIPGWTEALQMMPVGSKWQLAIPSNLAYGENAPPRIGPNSVAAV